MRKRPTLPQATWPPIRGYERDPSKPLGHTSEGSKYTDAESEFLRACEAFRGTLPIRRPITLTEAFQVMVGLGYRTSRANLMNLYRRKGETTVVEARRWSTGLIMVGVSQATRARSAFATTRTGVKLPLNDGDWVVGSSVLPPECVYSAEEFAALYEPVDG